MIDPTTIPTAILPTFTALLASIPGAEGGGRPVVVDLLIMLVAASVVAILGRRVRLSSIPSYLLTGAILGPTALGLIMSEQNVQDISGLAVMLLMFTIGLHLDPGEIRGGGMVSILSVGVVSTLGVVAVLWGPLALALGGPTGLAVAMALSMSSTAVLVRILQQTRETQNLVGRLCLGVSITQDLLSLGALAAMPLLAAWAGVGSGTGEHRAFLLPASWPAGVSAVVGVVGIAIFIVAARWVLPRMVMEAARGGSGEVALIFSAGAALGAAVFGAGMGFSPELGAFIAGFLLASTPARAQLAGQLSPIRDLLMAVFFTAVGLKLNFPVLLSGWWVVLLLVLASTLVKGAVIALTAWLWGARAETAVRAGLLLGQAGEFSLVVLASASGVGLINTELGGQLIATAVISLILTPVLYQFAPRLANALRSVPTCPLATVGGGLSKAELAKPHTPSVPKPRARPAPRPGTASSAGASTTTPEHSPHPAPASFAIIAGFGVVGRALADRFEVAGVPFAVVDLNQQTIQTQRSLGRAAIYGDISNREVLESAGIHSADVVILTIPDDDATLRACQMIRSVRADVYIAARTSFLSKAMTAMTLGADHVTVEEVATAETMARQVFDNLLRRKRAELARAAATPATPATAATAHGASPPAGDADSVHHA